ncbi:MAG: spore coat protein GerQ [Bacilli bacterium]|nr:spore coat protein GerQ [Bacilli bacterium]
MNNNFVNNAFPGNPLYSGGNIPNQQTANTAGPDFNFEQSYIENILRLNKGKQVQVYASYPDSNEWRDKIFSGIIEQSGRDHLILSDPQSGDWYLILMIYVNYIRFDERIISSSEFYPNN